MLFERNTGPRVGRSRHQRARLGIPPLKYPEDCVTKEQKRAFREMYNEVRKDALGLSR